MGHIMYQSLTPAEDTLTTTIITPFISALRPSTRCLPPHPSPLTAQGLGKTLTVLALVATNRAGVGAAELATFCGRMDMGQGAEPPNKKIKVWEQG